MFHENKIEKFGPCVAVACQKRVVKGGLPVCSHRPNRLKPQLYQNQQNHNQQNHNQQNLLNQSKEQWGNIGKMANG